MGQHCKRLVDLDLQGVPFISDKGLANVLSHGLLSELSLAECAITDVTLKNIARFCFASVITFNFYFILKPPIQQNNVLLDMLILVSSL